VSFPSLKPRAVSLKQIAENARSGHLYKLIYLVPKQQPHPAQRTAPQADRPKNPLGTDGKNPSHSRPEDAATWPECAM
jgi:hypothetical protein